jgi:superfamily II DNA/RNA helicase
MSTPDTPRRGPRRRHAPAGDRPGGRRDATATAATQDISAPPALVVAHNGAGHSGAGHSGAAHNGAASDVASPEMPASGESSNPSFEALGVPAPIGAVLARTGIDAPFPIQVATLPDTLAGRDVLGRGRTGSGKTLAFSIPLVARLAGGTRRARQPRALVLVPTRELANQVRAVVEPLARALHLTSTVVFGGVGQNPQVKALSQGVDILIACPGRLEDLVGQGFCDLSAVEITVLDEADHMADLGFLPGVRRLLDRTPQNGQRLLFSATLDNGVDVLVKRYLHQPVTHSVDPAVAPVSTMTHHVFSVSAADKPAVIQELAAGQERSLLFMRTKHTAKRLAKQLTAAGIPAVELHGNLSQGARERNLSAFTDGSTRVMVATDIAARGIHIDDVALVVHVDPPTEHKAYLHRSGRTARAGASGVVVTLALPDQAGDVRTLAKQAGIRPTTATVRPGAPEIAALTGPPAPYVEPPVELPEPVRARRPANGSRGGGQRSGGARTRTTSSGSSSSPAPAGRARTETPKAGGAKQGGRRGGPSAPARTRAELAARAGQQPPAPRRRSF